MTDRYELWGPFTGEALRPKPPLPWNIRRKRARTIFAMAVVAALVAVSAGLYGINKYQGGAP